MGEPLSLFDSIEREEWDFRSNKILYDKPKKELLEKLLNTPLTYCGFQFVLCEYAYNRMCAYTRLAHEACFREVENNET